MAGDAARAESLTQDLNKRFPLDTQMQSLWLPAIRAQLALNRSNPADGVNALQAAPLWSWGKSGSSPIFPASIQPTFAARYIWHLDRVVLPPPNFRRFSTTAASSGTAGQERCRARGWLARTPCNREPRAERMLMLPASVRSPPTKISSPSGKTPGPDIPVLKQAQAEYEKLR